MSPSVSPEPQGFELKNSKTDAVLRKKSVVAIPVEKLDNYRVSSPASSDSAIEVEYDRNIEETETSSAYCKTPVEIFQDWFWGRRVKTCWVFTLVFFRGPQIDTRTKGR